MANSTILETPRLLLRAARDSDAEFLFEAFSDAEVMTYWSEPAHLNEARTKEWVSSMTRSPQNGVTDFIICLKSRETEPKPVGKVGIYSGRPSNEIGFLLVRRYWHMGYAREALMKALDHICGMRNEDHEGKEVEDGRVGDGDCVLSKVEMTSEWMYPSISADTDPRNMASNGLLQKIGFVKSGYAEKSMKIGETWVDSQYWRLDREKWVDKRVLT